MSTAPAPYLIGMDGGGTGCRVAIARADGPVLATTQGGPANATTDLAATVANLRAALDMAAEAANLTLEALRDAPAHAGLAGVISDTIGQRVAEGLPLTRLTVTEDRDIMVAGALGPRDGALAAIGTGSFVAAQGPQGIRSVGGWGFLLSDEASGAWLGRELLRHALRVADGVSPPTPFVAQTLDQRGGAAGIVTFATSARAHDFATLAPGIVAAARAGDATATGLMTAGAGWITQGLRALDHRDGAPLCLTGGVGPLYAEWLPAPLTAGLTEPQGSALDGALRLAARAAP
ncbi:BadF/BadG/BcrA/BcrD ATPase family protein [Sagittula salina]|uniref:ATPase n=1 Tax=Sagittula salina TaxID=2820268 RepID=A0A940MP39_9RHOB|nr:BadF/BadG/BcrA/BcrD ATPase family protein [Sagittula salina]MBP0482161.1 ATPase [Sagittula salina]